MVVDRALDVLRNVPVEFWSSLSEMAPYLLFGFLAAGVLSVVARPALVERHLGGRGFWPVAKASMFGIPLPLCSCGVIPVGASLRRHGASRGATASFLLSTPQTGVDSILVTFSLLGPVFAVLRPLAALVTGLVGGGLVEAFSDRSQEETDAPPTCQLECCTAKAAGGKLRHILRYGFVTLPRDIAKTLLLGLFVAGLISALVPENYFAGVLGHGVLPMLLMTAVGVPIYVCATGSVPIAASLIVSGVSPGAALVFLMTGPATNAATIATVWKMLGRRAAAVYLATVAGSAILWGLLLDWLLFGLEIGAAVKPVWMLPGPVKMLSAVALLGVLGFGLFGRARSHAHAEKEGETEESVELKVEGMSCSHCVEAVSRALLGCRGVASAEVDLASGRAFVRGSGLDRAALAREVEEIGYGVTSVQH